jgi:hypothetical protein
MAISNFGRLCAALCDINSIPAPDLDSDSSGHIALEVTVDGVPVVVRHEEGRGDSSARLSVVLGRVPPQEELAACRALMDLNGMMLWMSLASFGRDRQSGEFVLHCEYPMARASAFDLQTTIRDLADVARSWRSGHLSAMPRK